MDREFKGNREREREREREGGFEGGRDRGFEGGRERGFEGNRERQGEREPGLINDFRREEGKIEGEFRDFERGHEQREADKYENRADKYERREDEDFNKGRFP
ncbi:unnamed protein product [Adineta steineri]|uniref:Uncharacterized protein n=1 Tax=Adineta steineri TaxID=433720 RepID=A0A814Q8R3_9BILA|nr:unnamed protein product [Adineta steineri]